MNPLFSSTLEECMQYMGSPQIAIDSRNMSWEDIDSLKQEITRMAARKGYKNLVWKAEPDKLYAF